MNGLKLLKMKGISHNKGLEEIVNRLSRKSRINWKDIQKNVEYQTSLDKVSGEIDVLAIHTRHNKPHYVLFEYKSTEDLREKAIQQLYRAYHHIKRYKKDKPTLFYVYGNKYEWIMYRGNKR